MYGYEDYQIITTPYTYLIYCIPTDEFYYGARWANGCHPSDLWLTYFTSSKKVHQRIELFGKDSFEFQVRKTFETGIKARKWEDTVLRRMKVIQSTKWINQSYGCVYSKRNTRKGQKMVYLISENRYMFMDEQLAIISELMGICTIKGPKKPLGYGEKISKKLKGRKKSNDHILKIRNSYSNNPNNNGWKVYTNGERNIHIKIGDTIPVGYLPGNALRGKSMPNKHIGKSYDEIYGEDRSKKLRQIRSKFFAENNPSLKIKGKSYDEIYGEEKANELRSKRSDLGKKNSKLYTLYLNGICCFSGTRMEAENYLHSIHNGNKTNNLYNKEWLNTKGITVHIQYMNR
jgi:hypothetical protein